MLVLPTVDAPNSASLRTPLTTALAILPALIPLRVIVPPFSVAVDVVALSDAPLANVRLPVSLTTNEVAATLLLAVKLPELLTVIDDGVPETPRLPLAVNTAELLTRMLLAPNDPVTFNVPPLTVVFPV